MMETRAVELRFAGERVEREVEIGVLANDDVAVEVARTELVAERPTLGKFETGRVIA